jgi:AcrR family transcriptional regulator
MQPLTKPRLDRDARREAILDVAQEVFLEEGFAAASMSTIAARLGGSKGTLYNYFKSKDELFTAYVERRCLWQQDAVYDIPCGASPEEALKHLARAYLTHVMDDTTLRNFRLIAAESERAPEIGRTFYAAGPDRGSQRLAGILTALESDGHLDLEGDPVGVAHQFVALVHGRLFKARLCNAIPELTPQEIEREATRGVRTFLRAFGTARA